MKQRDGWSKPYAVSFAVNKSCLRQLNAFDKSVSHIPHTPLLSKRFLNCPTIRKLEEGCVERGYFVGIQTDVYRESD